MNPAPEEPLPPPPQPPQPHRNSTSCDRHPDEAFTGFCPSCLCERLSVLDNQSSGSVSTGRKSASSALKSLFRGNNNERGRASSSSFLPELRRTKSFSGDAGGFLGFSAAGGGGGAGFEPQRKSCDVRGRSTLFSLLNQDCNKFNNNINININNGCLVNSNSNVNGSDINGGSKCGEGNSTALIDPDCCEGGDHVAEVSTVDEAEEEEEDEDVEECNNVGENEIQEVKEEFTRVKNGEMGFEERSEKSVDFKTMKDYIEIDTTVKKAGGGGGGGGGGGKDLKEKAGSFWSAASVFSKKLRAWTKKNQKGKKGTGSRNVGGKKGNCRDTQSEMADYGFGRRSCDTDPRFSLDAGRFSVDVVGPGRYSVDAGRYSVDAGRMSFDDPRGSFDEPRASWDGYLIGGRRVIPPMVSLVEDAPVVPRNDMQIPVEEPRRSSVSIGGGGDEGAAAAGGVPGGAAQTKDYYSDSSSKRRKSLDRSSSIRKTAAAVVAEMDELKSKPQPQPLPLPACVDYLSGAGIRVVANDRDLNLSSNSLRDNYSESFDLGFRDNGNGDRKGSSKKPRKWRAWNIWSLLYRRSSSSPKDDDDDKYSRANGVGRSFSESWQDYRRDSGYGYGYGGRNVVRSNSSVSWRNSYNNSNMGVGVGVGGSSGSFGSSSSIRQGGSIEVNGRKKKEEFVLERNRSARYSPKHGGGGDNNNGMLRFYLTPMRGSRRGSSGKPKPAAYSHSFARNMLRLY